MASIFPNSGDHNDSIGEAVSSNSEFLTRHAASSSIKKIVIVGRDAAAWLSALTLSEALKAHQVQIELIELPSLLTTNDMYTSMPALEGLHRLLGVNEWSLLHQTKGIFSLGSYFKGFSGLDMEFFLPFGDHGTSIDGVSFIDLWLHAKKQGLNISLEMFSLNARAARELKFFKPNDETNSLQISDYGYQFDAVSYIEVLRKYGADKGISVVSTSSLKVITDSKSTAVVALEIGCGRVISGDLYIDASGRDSLLLGNALNVPFESWYQHFPFYRKISASSQKLEKLPPYSVVRASHCGIGQQVALQDRTALTFTYNPIKTSSGDAILILRSISELHKIEEFEYLDVQPGFRSPWRGNVIGIGGAVSSLDPVLNSELFVVQIGLINFLDNLKSSKSGSEKMFEYNNAVRDALISCRDFQLIKYKYNRISDCLEWARLAKSDVPSGLTENKEKFEQNIDLKISEQSVYRKNDWLASFIGLGYRPRNFKSFNFDENKLKNDFINILDFIKVKVELMDSVDNFIEFY